MTYGTPTNFHSDTADFDGHGTYAVTAVQARSIMAVSSLMHLDGRPTNTCSLISAASLPEPTFGKVHVAHHTGRTIIVDTDGAIRTSRERLYPQHDYTLAPEPPAKPLAESGPNADIIPGFPSIPVPARTI
jgi:hypothetical protein